MLMNLKIPRRLQIGFALVALILVCEAGISVWKASVIERHVERIVTARIPAFESSSVLVSDIYGSLAALRGWLLTGHDAFREERAGIWADIARIRKNMDEIAHRFLDETNKEIWNQARGVLDEFASAQARVEGISYAGNQTLAIEVLKTEAIPRVGELLDLLNGSLGADGIRNGGLRGIQQKILRSDIAESAWQIKIFILTEWILLFVGIGLATSIAFVISRSIVRPIGSITGAMRELSQGQLEAEIPALDRRDEVGEMARAVQVFKEGLIKGLRMEKEAAHAEKDLNHTRSWMHEAIESMKDGVALFDANERLVMCNQAYRAVIDPKFIAPGVTFVEIARHLCDGGYYLGQGAPDFERRIAAFRQLEILELIARVGKTEQSITIHHYRTHDGGTFLVRTDISAIRNTTHALEQSEARLTKALQIAHLADWRMEIDGGAFVWGSDIWELFGIPRTTAPSIGALVPLIHPDDRDRAIRTLEEALLNGQPYAIEFRVIHGHDGKLRTIRSEAVVETDPSGRTVRLVGFCQDISERREWEALIRTVAQGLATSVGEPYLQSLVTRLAEVLDADMCLIGLIDGEMRDRIRTVSLWQDGQLRDNAAYRLSETPCADVIERGHLDVLSGINRLYPNNDHIIRERFRVYVGRRLNDSAGAPLGIIAVLSRRPLSHGKSIAPMIDIFARRAEAELERVHTESALRESEKKFRAIADFTQDWESWLGLDGRPLWVSPSVVRISGYEPGEVVAMPEYPYPLVHPEFRDALRDALATPFGNHLEFRLLHKDGSMRWAAASWSHIADSVGNPLGLRLSVRDITESKVLEGNMVQTAKLAMLGEMAAGLAHEMSQPLNIIQLAAGVAALKIDKSANKADVREELETIAGQTQRMGEIIDHVRVFSRRDGDKFKPFNSVAAVRMAVQLTESQHRVNDIEIVFEPPANFDAAVIGSRIQLEQVILNLLSNARDSICSRRKRSGEEDRPGYIRVAMSWIGNGKICIAVEDNGAGIPERNLHKILDPFFTTKAPGQGTGLGLSISYKIVAAMGGTIIAANTGDGARLEVVLPARAAVKPAAPPSSSQGARLGLSKVSEAHALSSMPHHVLVVDDEPDAARAMASLFANDGFRVSIAYEGFSAMRTFRRDPADLVVTDIRMPRSDGHTLIKNLSQLRASPPILVVTGHLGFTDAPTIGKNSSRFMVLCKPVTPDALLNAAYELLGGDRSHCERVRGRPKNRRRRRIATPPLRNPVR